MRHIVRIEQALALCLALAAPGAVLHAHGYPVKPVRLVIPLPPDGASDILARTVAERPGDALNQRFIVDNRPSGGSLVAIELVGQDNAGRLHRAADRRWFRLHFERVPTAPVQCRDTVLVPVTMLVADDVVLAHALFSARGEADALANDAEYGLPSAVWPQNAGRVDRVASSLQAGRVYVNDYMPIGVEAPFGGYKMTGHGREKGLEAVREYTELKAVAARYRG